MEKIRILHSWFYSAGVRYGWAEDLLDKRGVGIAKQKLFDNDNLIVEVDRVNYEVNCHDAIEFINKYKSFMYSKGVKIGIISKSLLKEIR